MSYEFKTTFWMDFTNEQMIEFINDYQYDNEETYLYIHPFKFE